MFTNETKNSSWEAKDSANFTATAARTMGSSGAEVNLSPAPAGWWSIGVDTGSSLAQCCRVPGSFSCPSFTLKVRISRFCRKKMKSWIDLDLSKASSLGCDGRQKGSCCLWLPLHMGAWVLVPAGLPRFKEAGWVTHLAAGSPSPSLGTPDSQGCISARKSSYWDSALSVSNLIYIQWTSLGLQGLDLSRYTRQLCF